MNAPAPGAQAPAAEAGLAYTDGRARRAKSTVAAVWHTYNLQRRDDRVSQITDQAREQLGAALHAWVDAQLDYERALDEYLALTDTDTERPPSD